MTINGTETQMKTCEPDVVVATAASETEPTAPTADDRSDAGDVDTPESVKSTRRQRSVSVSVRGLVVGAVIVALVAAVAALGWLYIDARHQLDAQALQSTNAAHAEKV